MGHQAAHRVEVLAPPAAGVRVHLAPAPPRPSEPAVEAAWAALKAGNSAFYDAPILSVRSLDLQAGVLACEPDAYRRLAAGAPGVEALAVTGVLLDADDRVLLARRGSSTRVYGSMWETAGRGTVEPAAGARSIDLPAQLRRELREELGESLADAASIGPPAALVRDHLARTLDVAFIARVPSGGTPPALAAQEYSASRWVDRGGLAGFERGGDRFSPPTRALLAFLGWL